MWLTEQRMLYCNTKTVVETYHETDEERKRRCFLTGNERRSPPEDQCKDPEDLGLSECIEQITPNGCSVRFAKWLFQIFTVNSQTILFASKGSNCSDRTGGFTCQLSRLCMSLLVGLILENDHTLGRRKKVSLTFNVDTSSTYQTNISRRNK